MMHTYHKFTFHARSMGQEDSKEAKKSTLIKWSMCVETITMQNASQTWFLLCIWIVGVIDEDKIQLSSDPVKIICPTFHILTREDKKTSQQERIKRHFSERGKFAENAWESVPSLQGFEPTAQDGTSYTSRLIKLWSFAHSGLQFVYAFLYIYVKVAEDS